MVVHQHHLCFHHQLRKCESDQRQQQLRLTDALELHRLTLLAYFDHILYRKKSNIALLRLTILCTLITCSLLLIPRLLSYTATTEEDPEELQPMIQEDEYVTGPSSNSIANSSMFCDRSAFRADICFMRGDVRTHSASNSILLVAHNFSAVEKIRPYTRKWETGVMDTIDELRLRTVDPYDHGRTHPCDVQHDVPAVVFSTGGYTGNVYHDFNDGLIPLYITSHRFDRKVVFVILDYHRWWITKYGDVISRLSDYPPIDFAGDPRTHCFSEVTVGLRIHDELAVDSSRMENNESIADFRQLLDDAYEPRIKHVAGDKQQKASVKSRRPKLVLVLRNGSRAIENEGELVESTEGAGFRVKVLRPKGSTPLARIYQAMSSCDAMVGVHGAAMTHVLFMRPGSVFIQIVPVGTEWAAAAYYGEPATKMGLHYVAYKILPRESSLHGQYEEGDPVLRDPESVNAKGWQATKKVYLDGQKVRLDLVRFRKSLVGARQYLISRRRAMELKQLQRPQPQIQEVKDGNVQFY